MALAAVQLANAVLPLFIMPLVLLKAGPDAYAEIARAEVISLLLMTIVLYSFEVEGVIEAVRVARDQSRKELSALMSEIIATRLFLWSVGLSLVLAVCAMVSIRLVELVAYWALLALAVALQPTWLFQGLGRNGWVSVTVASSRLAAAIAVIVHFELSGNARLVPLVVGMCYLAGSLAAIAMAVAVLGVQIQRVRWAVMIERIRKGRHLFFGNVFAFLYRDTGLLLLSLVGAPAVAQATYSLAEKFAKMAQAATRPVAQILVPHAVQAVDQSRDGARSLHLKLLKGAAAQAGLLLAIGGAMLAGAMWQAQLGLALVPAQSLREFALVLGLLILGCGFGAMTSMFGVAALSSLGHSHELFQCIRKAAIFYVPIGLLLSFGFQAPGVAWAFLISELLLLILVLHAYRRATGRRDVGLRSSDGG